MNRRAISLNLIAVAGLSLAFAMPAQADDGQFVGTLVGAGVGGAIGNTIGDGRVAATTAGIIVGGAIGNEVARSSYDASYAHPVSYSMYPYYNAYPYDMFPAHSNEMPYQPNYVAPPAPPPPPPVTYVDDSSGRYCRQFSQTTRIGNQVHETYGTACLQPDGGWHVVQQGQ